MGSDTESKPRRRSRTVRLAWFLAGNALLTAALVVGAFFYGWSTVARSLPDLRGWHLEGPPSEFHAEDEANGFTFDDYLARESRVFEELAGLVSGAWASDPGGRFSRFQADSICNPETILDRNWNRSYVLEAERPIGGALLVHGLSDSPYSLRALGERLHKEGYTVVGLRVPGHGTCPWALSQATWQDWSAAVRIAAKGLRAKLPESAPLVLVGYSNGGALCVEYTIRSIDDPTLPRPAAVSLFSPMIGITPMAEITSLYPLAARVSGQQKIAWYRIETEVDPFKYSSWPSNASLQSWRLTQRVEADLARLQKQGRMAEFPPVLAMQSAVDATVKVGMLIERLFDRLPEGASELVLFDVNRFAWLKELLDPSFEDAIRPRIERPELPYALTLVTNESPESLAAVAKSWRAGTPSEQPLGLAWPKGVFSLSHGAMPISPDDPVLGTAEATAKVGLHLGSLDLHGESGVLMISESLMVRLRHNPFYEFAEQRVVDWLSSATSRGAEPPTP